VSACLVRENAFHSVPCYDIESLLEATHKFHSISK